MSRHLFASSLSLALVLALAAPSQAAPAAAAQASADKPLVDVKADPLTGKIIATLPKPDAQGVSARYIYLTQLGSGLGSAPIGLDRASASETRILAFRRLGKKVAAEIENSKFIASSGDPDEQHAVDTSFATSTLWMGDVINTAKDGSYTVDLAGFLARDDLDVVRAIKNGGGGEFKFVPELSAADPNFVKVFPKNAEFAAKLTFRSDKPEAEVSNIVGGDTLTLVLRHSLIALPEPGYVQRTDLTATRSGFRRSTSQRRWVPRSSMISRGGSGSRRSIPQPGVLRSRSRLSSTSTEAHPSRSALRLRTE